MYKTSVRALGNFGARYFSNYFGSLKEEIIKSNLSILYEIYIGKMLLLTIASFFASLFGIAFVFIYFVQLPLLFAVASGFVGAAAAS